MYSKHLGNNKEEYEDNYLERKLFTEIEQNVEKRILPFRSDVKISAVIDKKLEKEVTLLEYIKDEHFLIAMVIVDSQEAFVIVDSQEAFQNMDKVLIEIRDIYPNLKIKLFVYLLDEDKFDNYIEYSKVSTEITKAVIRKYLPKIEKILN